MNGDGSSEKCYGPKRSVRNAGWFWLLFYSTVAIGHSWLCLANAHEFPRPVAAAIFFGTFWSGWTLLCVWLLCVYYRERLFLDRDRITKQGVLFRHSLAMSELSSVCWRGVLRQGGSVVLRTSSARVVIGLGNFEPHEQDEIIAFVQQHAPPKITTGWEVFVKSREPPPRVPSRGIAALCGLLFLALGCVLIYGWYVGMGLHIGLSGLSCLLCSVWYAVRIVRFRRAATTAS